MARREYRLGGHYVCLSCGNEIEVVHAGGGRISCCIQPMQAMELQEAATSDSRTDEINVTDVYSIAEYSLEQFVTKNLTTRSDLQVDVYYFQFGQSQDIHTHSHSTQVLSLLEGRGIFYVGEKQIEVTTGATVTITPSIPHGIKNTSAGTMVVLAVSVPKL